MLGIVRKFKDFEDDMIVICALKILNSVCMKGDFRLLHSLFQLIRSTSCSEEIRDEACIILGIHSKSKYQKSEGISSKLGGEKGFIGILIEILKKENWYTRESAMKILLTRCSKNDLKKESIEYLLRYLIEYSESKGEINSKILLNLSKFIDEKTTFNECNQLLLQIFTDEKEPNFKFLLKQTNSNHKIIRDISLYLLYNFLNSNLDSNEIDFSKF